MLIADDHAVVRQGLRTFLEVQDDIEVVGEAADGDEAIAMVQTLSPDAVILDLVMPRVDGIEALARIRDASPTTRVIVLTSFADESKIAAAIKAGAAAYLLKDVRPQELAEAIRAVSKGDAYLHPAVAATLMRQFAYTGRPPPGSNLTERETDVLRLLARGRSNKEIALELGVAEKTVKTHVSSIFQKLHLADRTQAALYAVRERLVELE